MHRRALLALAAPALLALVAGCQSGPSKGPAYNGPRPSPKAVFVLRELGGQKLQDLTGALGGGDWTIGRYAVVKNPVSAGGLGPVVQLEKGGDVVFVPIETDGDVGDLYRRVHRTSHPDLGEDVGAAYAAVWKK